MRQAVLRYLNVVLCTAVVLTAAYTGYAFWTKKVAFSILYDEALGQTIGPKDAKFVLVAFIDYRCPHCLELNPIIERVLEENPDVRIIYKYMPVYGELSLGDARLALAAGKLGKFREAHEYLLHQNEDVDESAARKLIADLGVDLQKLHEIMFSAEIEQAVMSPVSAAARLNIASVPAFVHDGVVYSRFRSVPTYDDFRNFLSQIRSKS